MGPRPSCRRRGGSAPQAPGGGQETVSVSSWRTSLAGPSTSRQRGGKDRLGEAAQTSVALTDEEPLHVVVMPPAPIPRCRVRQTLSQGRCYSVEPKRWAVWLGKSWMAFPPAQARVQHYEPFVPQGQQQLVLVSAMLMETSTFVAMGTSIFVLTVPCCSPAAFPQL